MEGALNLVWLVTALASLLLWTLHVHAIGGNARRWFAGAFLVACCGLVLFPAISASDDAQWAREVLPVLETSGSLPAWRGFGRLEAAALMPLPSMLATALDFHPPLPIVLGFVASDHWSPQAVHFVPALSGRAPPRSR